MGSVADVDLEKRMRMWEELIQKSPDVRARERTLKGESVYEISIHNASGPTPPERLKKNDFKEYWVQRYVAANFKHKRFGFSAIKGPMELGPDFKVKKGSVWYDAEVEIGWRKYSQHGHPSNPHFKSVKYLIILSADDPPAEKLKLLPPQIIHIDRAHFLEWYELEGKRYAQRAPLASRLNARANIVAGAMQEAFVGICGDTERDMATCPNCDGCAYFGDGTGGARLVFQRMAMDYLAERAVEPDAEPDNLINLRKVAGSDLRAYVLMRALSSTMTED